jgi:hypothetical protein
MEEKVCGSGNTKDFGKTFEGSRFCAKPVVTQAATFSADLVKKAGHR